MLLDCSITLAVLCSLLIIATGLHRTRHQNHHEKNSSLVLCFIIVKCSLRCNKFFSCYSFFRTRWASSRAINHFCRGAICCHCHVRGQGQTNNSSRQTEASSDDLFRVHFAVFYCPLSTFPSHICFLHRSGRIIYPSRYLHTWSCLWSCEKGEQLACFGCFCRFSPPQTVG